MNPDLNSRVANYTPEQIFECKQWLEKNATDGSMAELSLAIIEQFEAQLADATATLLSSEEARLKAEADFIRMPVQKLKDLNHLLQLARQLGPTQCYLACGDARDITMGWMREHAAAIANQGSTP